MMNDPDDWPKDLVWVLEAYLKARETWTEEENRRYGPSHGYPRFFLLKDRQLMLTAWGLNNGWHPLMKPKLIELLGNK